MLNITNEYCQIVEIVTSFLKFNKQVLETSKDLIISLGSGSAATEMSSDLPCLCLDNDRRAIYSSIINLKGNVIGKKQFTYHSVFDIRRSNELLSILQNIKHSLPDHTVKILFQHPDPSLDSTYDTCGKLCIKALCEKLIAEIHFVYDSRVDATCFKRDEIIDRFMLKSCSEVTIGEEFVISEQDDISVIHPLFGFTSRLSWAKMKKGNEHTFCVKC